MENIFSTKCQLIFSKFGSFLLKRVKNRGYIFKTRGKYHLFFVLYCFFEKFPL